MELRALLCWASLAAALEGEFPRGHPGTPGAPKVGPWREGAGLSAPSPAPQPRALRTNSARPGGGRGGGGPAGSGVFFCLEKRRSGAPSRDVPLPQLPRLLALIRCAFGSLSLSPHTSLSKVSVPLPTSAKHEETFLKEQLQTRQNFVLGQKTAPTPNSSAFHTLILQFPGPLVGRPPSALTVQTPRSLPKPLPLGQ